VSHYTHTDPYSSKTEHNIDQYREKCLKRGDVGCAKPHAQCTSNVKGTVISRQYSSESRTAISNRLQVDTRSEIHMNIKVNLDARNRRLSRFHAQFYYEHVSKRCGKAKTVSI
jgi:hypothetical protein